MWTEPQAIELVVTKSGIIAVCETTPVFAVLHRLLLPLPFCFFFFLSCWPSEDPLAGDAGASSAGRFLSNDLRRALARSSAIFSASLLLNVLLSDCDVISDRVESE